MNLTYELLKRVDENASGAAVSAGAFASVAKPLLREDITPEIKQKLLTDWRVARGLKIPSKAAVWRGVSADSGSGMASYGQGLYTTLSKAMAKQYGDVIEMDRYEHLPQSPLRFRTVNDYQIWEQSVAKAMGFTDMRDFNTKYHDVSHWVRELDPNVDGIQIGTGKDAFFVKWPDQ